MKSLDSSWRFARGDFPDASRPGFDDVAWQELDVPHDWAIAGPFDKEHPASGEGGFLPTGVAWYRKHFGLPRDLSGKRVFVEFDGVMAHSDVWINAHPLGHRPNGYVSFRYDMTEHLRRSGGAENVLAVRTDTSAQVASRWYTGSGIYRHVRLIAVDPLHIDYGGVFVTTPSIEDGRAVVRVRVAVRNGHGAPREFVIHTTVLDEESRGIASAETPAQAEAGGTCETEQDLVVEKPELWDIESPHMYRARCEIVSGGVIVDGLTTPFGIREAEFRAGSGFWLNGRNTKIKGVCLHHCGGPVGAAVPLGVWESRLEKLQQLGVNAVRTAHNPVAPEFLDLCDRMGLLVMDEFFDCWTVGKRKHDYHLYFNDWAHRDMRDTILRDRNHPSIILYSVGNEIHDTPKEEMAKRILRGLVGVCHETDPSRPVTQALFRPNVSHDYDNGLADMLDVIGTNYRDQELLQAWRDKPTRKIIGTEQTHDRRTWLACRDNPQHAGQFLWVGIDYLGESRRWPVTTFNSGLLDRTGHVHPRGYERQSWWSDEPMVRVFRRIAQTEETPVDPGYETVEWKRRQVLFPDWTPRDLGPHTEAVEVYSNCDEVELLLNGRSLGVQKKRADAGARSWKVPFEPGRLTAIARNGGSEAARDELRTAGAAHRVVLEAESDSLSTDWDDVAIVEARVVDADGVTLPRAADEIVFSVSGPGEIVAVDNGSIVSHEPFRATQRRTFQGRCVAIIRATGSGGKIVVGASAEGLKPGSVELTSR